MICSQNFHAASSLITLYLLSASMDWLTVYPGIFLGTEQEMIRLLFFTIFNSIFLHYCHFFLSNTRGTLSSQRVSIIMCVPGFNPLRDGEERIEFQLLLSEDDNPSVQGINDITKIDL